MKIQKYLFLNGYSYPKNDLNIEKTTFKYSFIILFPNKIIKYAKLNDDSSYISFYKKKCISYKRYMRKFKLKNILK